MALLMVGGSFLSAFLNVLFDKITSQEFVDFIKRRRIDDALLKKLKTMLLSVNRVLDDAEEKQITDTGIRAWFDELQDAIYEADDLLDEISYKALRLKIEAGYPTPADQVKTFFSSFNLFKKGLNDKLDEIIDRLEFLGQQMGFHGLKMGIVEKPNLQKMLSTSLLDESSVYGRDDDKEAIIRLLLCNDANGYDLGVIPIVGMGGVGKTTLAQFAYNDVRVQEWFDIRVWVCVSEESDVFKITKDILKELTSLACDSMTANQLQLELKEIITGKSFLLVLDDVWKCKYTDWENLQIPLKFGAQGSKILITTRDANVASTVRTVPTHYLKELTDDDCWSLFAKHAFDVGISGGYLELEETGRKIVKKCKGLPLAAKVLGGLLRSSRNVEEWDKVLKSSLWNSSNDILPALRLSYHYLPSHLKRCFAYSAIFPKDYEFEKKELILLWMAEGFLVHSFGDKEMEEVGDDYFQELLSRSFFQRSSDSRSCFIMHDLINDLAKNVSGEFCSRLEGEDSGKVTKKTRHLSYVRAEDGIGKKFESLHEAQLLRTFLLVEWSSIDNEVMNDILLKFRKLRVLSLSQYRSVAELPKSIGHLKHLRYLNLSTASIKSLPETVTVLYNLQTLILHECTDLSVLPETIGNLKHLCYLDISGTLIISLPKSFVGLCNLRTLILCQCKELLELPTHLARLINLYHLDIEGTKLQEMPPQMGQLKNLHVLTCFILRGDGGSNIKELGELQHLRGKLCILNLESIVDSEDAREAILKGKKHLKELELRWNSGTDNSVHQKGVFEELQPHVNIECLSIFGYKGEGLPDWLGDPSFSNIVSLKLSGLKYCFSLPPLGQLASLKELSITDFDGVVDIGPEFYGNCTSMKKPFGSLKILKFERMPKWHNWITYADKEEYRAFPLLQELYIRECPNLIASLPSHLPSLTTLEIEGCLQLVASLPRAPAILKMKIKDESRDVLLKHLPSGLHSLTIDRYYSIDSIIDRMVSFFRTLEVIDIRSHDSLKCFPLELFPSLKSFRITRCPILESLHAPEAAAIHENLASLNSLEIRECPNLTSFFEGRLLPAPNLARLLLLGFSNVESFPEKMLLPSSLISLKIWDFQNLKYMDYSGLQHLTSLRELEICNCPMLQSMPEEGLPLSLSSLSVNLCPLLEPRCQREMGEDWHKISHIAHVKVNLHKIN